MDGRPHDPQSPLIPVRNSRPCDFSQLARWQQQCGKTGGTLTYVYHPEPTALSTIATSAVPVAIISTKIYESLLSYEGAEH